MKSMVGRRFLSLFLCFLMLTGIPAGASADSEAAGPVDFEETVQAQAFAIAMACWYNGFDASDTVWPFFAWEATGWYAAWLHRVQNVDLLPAKQASEFQRSLGMLEELSGPENWLGEYTPEALRSPDDSIFYDFREYKLRLDELLGVEIECSFAYAEPLTEEVTVIQHFDDLAQTESAFRISFEENPDPASRFDYRFAGIDMPTPEPELDPALTFTWEQLEEANRLKNILSLYPSVRCYNREYSFGNSIWLFLRDGEPVMLSGVEGAYSGEIHGCSFDYGETEDGTSRARISNIDTADQIWETMDSFLLDYCHMPVLLRLNRVEGDLIWADAVYSGGYRQKLAFDYGTLVLREVVSLSEAGVVLGSTVFEYLNPAPQPDFLKSWDSPLRTVHVVWESYPDGIRELRREDIEIPADWEYLPYQAVWGDYTAYTNEEYLGDYAYPGDGTDYTLFLTTVKG